jgi:hypothetical protein
VRATIGPALHPSRVQTTDHPARARQGALLMTAMSDETEGGPGGAAVPKGFDPLAVPLPLPGVGIVGPTVTVTC